MFKKLFSKTEKPFLEESGIYTLDAVHPIAMRVLKSNLTLLEMLNLKKELIDLNYDPNLISITREDVV